MAAGNSARAWPRCRCIRASSTRRLSTRAISPATTPSRRPCRASRPAERPRYLSQDRVLLLHAAALRKRRGARHDGALHPRSGAAAGYVDRITLAYTFYDQSADGPQWPITAEPETTSVRNMAHAHAAHDRNKYYVPHGSPWPIFGSIALFADGGWAPRFSNECDGSARRGRCCRLRAARASCSSAGSAP